MWSRGRSGRGCRCPRLQAIDEAGDVAGAEAVIDIDHSDVAGATVEHAEQGGESVEAGSIADAGGHGDDGASDEAADGAGQGAFHARADHYHARFGEALAVLHEAMDARHPDVVDGVDAIAHDLGGGLGLFGDGHVAGAGADHGDSAFAGDGAVAPEADDAREREVVGAGEAGEDGIGAGAVGAGDEDVGGVFEEGFGDGDHLFGGFALGEDDFGDAVAEGAVVIDFGEAEVLEGQVAHAREGAIDFEFARADLLEHGAQLVLIHETRITGGRGGTAGGST